MNTAPCIPDNAPFSTEQRAWLNGLLAGIFSSAPAEAVTTPTRTVTLLFGSQSGNAEALAKSTAKAAKAHHIHAQVTDLADFDPAAITDQSHLLIITSTYGDGEPPDNARAFHDFLMSDKAPRLENLHFAILGLGDSTYPDFNKCAIDFDKRLTDLGATRLCDSVYCDVEFEDDAAAWQQAAFTALAPTEGDSSISNLKSQISNPNSSSPDLKSEISNPKSETLAYDKKHPYPARVLDNHNLNLPGSTKETRHLALSLGHSGLSYAAGDALGVLPANSPRLVDAIIEASGLPEDAPTQLPDGSIAPLYEALGFHYDINRLTSAFIDACARLDTSGYFTDILADKDKTTHYLSGRNLLDPIREAKLHFPDTEHLIAPLKKLQPRVYSISSSPKAHPGEVHLTVGTVRWEAHGSQRLGVCSNYIASLQPGQRCRVFVQPNHSFRPPAEPTAPMIMVGPGTGIAPFRAFIEERAMLGHTGRNWLFFGDQKAATDFLYATELSHWQKRGILSRLDTAFSRDQADKIYVQDRMIEHGAELYAWLETGAHFYVCGDASRMARDVDAALHTIIAQHSNKGQDFATNYITTLRSSKRYLRDVY